MGNSVLIVATGEKKDVFRDLSVLGIHEGRDDEITILTERYNFDLFSHFKNVKIYPYEMNAESFLILRNRKFNVVYNMARTELSYEFLFETRNHPECYSVFPPDYNSNPNDKYYFETISHPIDHIHSLIKRKSSFLVGINIGEYEHPSKKIPVGSITKLMRKLSALYRCRFVLFGSGDPNSIREDMISRKHPGDIISAIGLENPPELAQAIDLCDVFVSIDSLFMHLALAIEKETIGIFAVTTPYSVADFDFLTKITPANYHSICPCKSHDEPCSILENFDENMIFENYCYNNIEVDDIIASISEILQNK